MMKRREFLRRSAIGAGLLAGASTAYSLPKLKITKVNAVELNGFNSKFVRVHTDEGLTGTGEIVDTIGAAQIINEKLGPSIEGFDPLDIEGIYFHFWGWGKVPDATWPVFMRGAGGGPYHAAVSGIEIALW